MTDFNTPRPKFPPAQNPFTAMGLYTAAAPTLIDGQQYPLRLDVNGRLIVTPSGGDATYARLDGTNQPFTGVLRLPDGDTATPALTGATTTNGLSFGAVRATFSGTGTPLRIFSSNASAAILFQNTASATGFVEYNGATSMDFSVANALAFRGSLTKLTVAAAVATPAGGTTGSGIQLGTTANLGVFFGSGVPTLSAAQGSLYIRSDGSGVADRMYVNTNGTTGWTNFVSAA